VGDKTRNIAIILYLTRFAIIACLAGAKRGGGWEKSAPALTNLGLPFSLPESPLPPRLCSNVAI